MLGAHGGQKRELDPLVLELQMFVDHHVNTRNQTLSPLQDQVLLTMKPHFFCCFSVLLLSLKY